MQASIVTGGGRGVGRAIALRLAQDGPVVLVGRNAADLDATVAEIAARGGIAIACAGDVADPATSRRALAALQWPLHHVVCNAGIGRSGATDAVDPADWQRVFDVNVNGCFHLVRAALPLLAREPGHAITIVSSLAGVRGVAYDAAYTASKHALVGFARALGGDRGAAVRQEGERGELPGVAHVVDRLDGPRGAVVAAGGVLEGAVRAVVVADGDVAAGGDGDGVPLAHVVASGGHAATPTIRVGVQVVLHDGLARRRAVHDGPRDPVTVHAAHEQVAIARVRVAARAVAGEHRRAVGGGSAALGGGLSLLGAVELQAHDGPWTVPEGLRKANGILSLSGGDKAQGFSASLMAYGARWTATDQIPQRLIDAGRYQGQAFGRFDSLDPTDGGDTQRRSLSGEWHRQTDEHTLTRVSAYAIDYRLRLYSDFSYAMERPATGDQFLQQDRRQVYGLAASHAWDHALGALEARSEMGLQLRQDRARVGLADTTARQVTTMTRDDALRETLLGVYGQTQLALAPWLRAIVGLRADGAWFTVDSRLSAANSGSSRAQRLSPKLSLVAGPWQKTEFFFNAGRGFHSNDARGTTATVDPRTGEALSPVPGLVAAKGMELGARSEWLPYAGCRAEPLTCHG